MGRPDKPDMTWPALLPSDYLARLFDELAEIALVGLDEQGTIRAWSGGARALFGYERAAIEGSSFAILLSQNDPGSCTLPRLLLKARNLDLTESECVFRGRDGADLPGRL